MHRLVHRIHDFPTRWLGSFGTGRSDLDVTVKYTDDYIEIETVALVYVNADGDEHVACADDDLAALLIPKIEDDDDVMDELSEACGKHEAQIKDEAKDRHYVRAHE